RIASAMVGAVLLSAFHYASVIAAIPYVRLQDLNFPHHASDITLYFHLGPGLYHALIVYAVLAILAWSYWWNRYKQRALSETEITTFKIGLWMGLFIFFLDLSPVSAPAWNAVKPLQMVQLPWRFYSLILLFSVIMIGVAQSSPLQTASKWVSVAWIGGAVLP